MAEALRPSHGLIDTSVVIALENIDAGQLSSELAISALTMAELAADPHAAVWPRWSRSGVNLDEHIGALSTYPGHVSPADT